MNFRIKKALKQTAILLIAAVICIAAVLISRGNVAGKTVTAGEHIDHNANILVTADGGGNGLMKISVMADYGDVPDSPQYAKKQITATVMPATAENKSIKWEVSWKNSTSDRQHSGGTGDDYDWGHGKTVTDYITLSADTTESGEPLTVSCKQDFGEPVVIKAVSASNQNVYATCTVDYCQKIKSLNYSFKYGETGMTAPVAKSNGLYLVDYTGEAKSYTVECTPVYTNYTIADSFEKSISGELSDEFGYTASHALTEICLQAGLQGGNYEPELSSAGEQYVQTVSNAATSSGNPLLAMMDYAEELYAKLSETDKAHSKTVNAHEVYELMREAITASGNGTLTEEKREEAISLLNGYTPPAVTGNFTGGATIAAENELLTAAKACNDAGEGIVGYTITYVGVYSEAQFTLKLGYTEESVTAVRKMTVTLPALLF